MKSLQASAKPRSDVVIVRGGDVCASDDSVFGAWHGAICPRQRPARGDVVDPSGAVLADATVTARNQATGVSETTKSGADGHFVFLYLAPGAYEVSILKSGFQNVIYKDVVVNVGTTATIRPQMTLGKVESIVTVTAAPALVDTTQSSLSTVVGQQSIESLPLNGRDFTDFVLLTPGAATDGEFGNISFHGLSGNYNNYTVDGGNNNNAFYAQATGRGTIPFQFSQDIVQEFQVASTGFEAEFGQSGGGVVNTVTKSGTNQVTETRTTTSWIQS